MAPVVIRGRLPMAPYHRGCLNLADGNRDLNGRPALGDWLRLIAVYRCSQRLTRKSAMTLNLLQDLLGRAEQGPATGQVKAGSAAASADSLR